MYLSLNPTHPAAGAIAQAAAVLRADGVIIYPTDTIYGLGCRLGSTSAVARIYQLKGRQRHKPFSFICRDITQASRYGLLSNATFRLMKRILPGPYTIVVPATAAVPRFIQPKNRTIGIRIPRHPATQALVDTLDEPLITTSVNTSGEPALSDPGEIRPAWEHRVDLILEAGVLAGDPSTVLDCTVEPPQVLRLGAGPWPT